ncbi:MAG: hypothetical protein GX650_01050 [Clostridiales bacterium]|nr:hypothetical protein [Clostridiales bacterium]
MSRSTKMTFETIQSSLDYWEEMKAIWLRCDPALGDDADTIVFKLYFRLQSVTAVFEECKRLGIQGFKTPKDVTLFLQQADIADSQLQQRTRELQAKNIQKASQRWW